MNTLEMLKDLGHVDPPDQRVLERTADTLVSAAAESICGASTVPDAGAESLQRATVRGASDVVPGAQRAWGRRRRVNTTGSAGEPRSAVGTRTRIRVRPRQRRAAMVAVAAVIVLLVSALVAVAGHGLGVKGPVTTSWQAGRPLRSDGHEKAGQWQLVDDVLSGTWQQSTSGPPPGTGMCPTADACYEVAGKYASASAAEPESESFYASTDVGATWTVLPMPTSFVATSGLSCAAATVCAVGGTYQGQSVMISTTDGGHSFVISPLPASVGTLYALSCPTSTFCGGLVATTTWHGLPPNIPIHAAFLSTSDGGKTFADASPFLAGDSMQSLVCSSTADCTVIGNQMTNASPTNGSSVVAVTTDAGRTWTQGAFPVGFNILTHSTLACPDASHCYVAGSIPSTTGKTATPVQLVAATVNGGLTWSEQTPPGNVPRLGIMSLSCPTVSECWIAGMYRPERETPVLLGTTNSGATWSRVTFSVPAGAPNYDGQSYITMGQISCATANVCVARGAVAQGSPTSPVYSLDIPNG